jgi:hypothetical protein
VGSGPKPAAALEQHLADVAPDGVRPIEPDGVGLLDLHDPKTAKAFDPEKLSGDLGRAPGLDPDLGRSGGARVRQDGVPPSVVIWCLFGVAARPEGPQPVSGHAVKLVAGRHSP